MFRLFILSLLSFSISTNAEATIWAENPPEKSVIKGKVSLQYKVYGHEFGIWPFKKDRITVASLPVTIHQIGTDKKLAYYPYRENVLAALSIGGQNIAVDIRNSEFTRYYSCEHGYGFILDLTPNSYTRVIHTLVQNLKKKHRKYEKTIASLLEECVTHSRRCTVDGGPYSEFPDFGRGGYFSVQEFDHQDINVPVINFEPMKFFWSKGKNSYHCKDVKKWKKKTRKYSSMILTYSRWSTKYRKFDYEFETFYVDGDPGVILKFEFSPTWIKSEIN